MVAREHKTGPGYMYILCDVCGRKIRQKDAILITDKWNTQSSLLVCKDDVDKTNPQAIPFTVKETQITNPKLVRSEAPDVNIVNPDSDRAPSAITTLVAATHPLNNSVLLMWQGPENVGSDPITSYIITRAQPQDGVYETIGTTNNVNTYEDSTATITTFYSYIIYAVNAFGTSPASNIAYFPYPLSDTGSILLTISQSPESFLQTGAGEFIQIRL